MSTVTAEQRDWIKRALGMDLPSDGDASPGEGPAPALPAHLSNATAPQATDAVEEENSDKETDVTFQKAIADKNWKEAALNLNFFSSAGMNQRLAKLPPDVVVKLHKAAVGKKSAGASSPAALATEVLAHPTLGSQQETRATALEAKLSPEDQIKYHALLDGAKSAKEKQYITKGLAATHTIAELADFAKKIAGKDAKWMQDNLSLTGSSDGSGVMQQWSHSCGPTTFEAVQGELDPLYSLKKHEDNAKLNTADDADGNKNNPNLAADQKAILQAGGGVAVDRGKKGTGMWITDALTKVAASTGLKYENKKIGDGTTLEEGITALNDATSKGEPVPIVIGNEGNEKFAHYVLVTASDPGPPRYYKIHDPWFGKTVTRSEDQLRKGNIDIAGCNKFAAFDKPTPVEVK